MKLLQIDNILVDENIGRQHFECDLEKCKGACCTFPGEYGAPVLDEEIDEIKNSLGEALGYLAEKSVRAIENEGFITGTPGDYTTNCIEKKDCVFVYYKNDIAFCSLESAWRDGKTKFRKPLSCHLFPIRVGSFGGDYLYYEKISECGPAIPNGEKQGVRIYESVKEAIIRKYGDNWYNKYVESLKDNPGKKP